MRNPLLRLPPFKALPWRATAAALLLGAAVLHTLNFVKRFHAIQDWLAWPVLLAALSAAFFAVAVLSLGHLSLRLVLRRPWPLLEHLSVAFAVGLLGFGLAVQGVGLFGGLGPVLYFALPLVCLAAGGPGLFAHLKRRLTRRRPAPATFLTFGLIAFGVLVVVMAWFTLLASENVSYDARWKHLALAEHYVASGAVDRFPNGWVPAAHPHLPSFLYAWALMAPVKTLYTRLLFAGHLELVIFLWSLVGVSALVGRLVSKADVRVAWVARLAFPGILLYDANLSLGTDHIAAAWAAPIFLMLLRSLKRLSPRPMAALALVLAGGMQTKYSAVLPLTLFPLLALGGRGVFLLVKPGRLRRVALFKGPALAVGVGLLATAGHWLKNWVWYGDPIYPLLHQHLNVTPWGEAAGEIFRHGYSVQQWKPSPGLLGIWESLKALISFAHIPHDWKNAHRDWPVFGFLFTLTLPTLAVIKPSRRQLLLVGFVLTAIFAWYQVHHQDRHLQTLMPLIAAATAAALVRLWRMGLGVKVGVGALVLVQLVWGGDTYFLQTHSMIHQSPVKKAVDLVSSGFEGKGRQRDWPFGSITKASKVLPEDAVVLVHDLQLTLGLNRRRFDDLPGWQAGFDYAAAEGPGAIYDQLKAAGITHVVADRLTRGWRSLSGDLKFALFAKRHLKVAGRANNLTIFALPDARPEGVFRQRVAYLGCRGYYPNGVYEVGDLNVLPMRAAGPDRKAVKPAFPKPRWPLPTEQVDRDAVEALVIERDCKNGVPNFPRGGFELAATRRRPESLKTAFESTKLKYELWVRRAEAKVAAPEPEAEREDEQADPDQPEPFEAEPQD